MKTSISSRLLLAALGLCGSGCYMHLDPIDAGIVGRLDAMEQRVAALEQGKPPATPPPPTISSTSGRISKAQFTQSTPATRKSSTADGKPVGRIRLKDQSSLHAPKDSSPSSPDDN